MEWNHNGMERYHQCRYEVHQLAASVRPGQSKEFLRLWDANPTAAATQTQTDQTAPGMGGVLRGVGFAMEFDVNLTQAQIVRAGTAGLTR